MPLSVYISADMTKDVPSDKQFDRDFQQRRIEETITALSSIIPDLARRVVARMPSAVSFSVELTPDEYADLDDHVRRHAHIGRAMIDGEWIRPAR